MGEVNQILTTLSLLIGLAQVIARLAVFLRRRGGNNARVRRQRVAKLLASEFCVDTCSYPNQLK